MGCSTNTFVIHSFILSFTDPLVKISVWRRHAQTVKNCASSHTTNYTEILNVERASKLLYWYKSYGDIAEWVDFA